MFEQQPHWRPAPTIENQRTAKSRDNIDSALTHWDEPNGPRAILDELGRECVLPYQRYMRAIDPAGNLVPLVVSTNRVTHTDGTNYETVVRQKQRRKIGGWLFIDEPPYGRELAEWQEWCAAEAAQRRSAHLAYEQRYGEGFQSQAQVALKAAQGASAEAVREIFEIFLSQFGKGVEPPAGDPHRPGKVRKGGGDL